MSRLRSSIRRLAFAAAACVTVFAVGTVSAETPPAEKASPSTISADGGAGQGGPTLGDRLKPVNDQMRRAEQALAARDVSGRASAAQQQAVSQLDLLIGELQKQCEKCGGQCQKPGSAQSKPSPGNKPGTSPGQATAAATASATAPADRSAIGQLVKDFWGKLPERQRDELLQPLSEEFLPEYAADIQEYFRVLAESPKSSPAEKQP